MRSAERMRRTKKKLLACIAAAVVPAMLTACFGEELMLACVGDSCYACAGCIDCPGCTTNYGRPYGKQRVLAYVDDICGEEYELVSEEDDVYNFHTVGRGLEFTAQSYLRSIDCDGATGYYQKEISCDYVENVRARYIIPANDAMEMSKYSRRVVMLATSMTVHAGFNVYSFDDIAPIIEKFVEAEEIYARELEYNSAQFLADNPLGTVTLYDRHLDKKIVTLDIGTLSYDEAYNIAAEAYGQAVVNGLVSALGGSYSVEVKDNHSLLGLKKMGRHQARQHVDDRRRHVGDGNFV